MKQSVVRNFRIFFLGVLYACLKEVNTACTPTPKWISPCGPSPLISNSDVAPKTISLETAYSWLYENAVNFQNAVSTLISKYVRICESYN